MPAEIKEEERTVPGMDADKDIPITQELEARHGSIFESRLGLSM